MVETVSRIIDYLDRGEYVSGQELADHLGITRAAVWKQVENLRELGYKIEAHSRKGYVLAGRPDRLYPWEVAKGLKTRFIGRKIEYYEKISSTNKRAKELISSSPPEGTLILAEEQTGGRGRLGRSWFSPPGAGIWMTVILTPKLPPAELPKLTLVGAVALSKAVYKELSLRPLVKWPNDLYLEDRKITGILTELSGEMGRLEYLILGVGVNVNQSMQDFPPELGDKAGSLRIFLGRSVSRISLLRRYLEYLEKEYLTALKNGFSEVISYCRNYSVTLGNRVEVTDGERIYRGEAVAIDENGALILKKEDGQQVRVLSGEVNLPPDR